MQNAIDRLTKLAQSQRQKDKNGHDFTPVGDWDWGNQSLSYPYPVHMNSIQSNHIQITFTFHVTTVSTFCLPSVLLSRSTGWSTCLVFFLLEVPAVDFFLFLPTIQGFMSVFGASPLGTLV